MAGEIRISAGALGSVEASLLGGVDEYCSFELLNTQGVLPDAASASHDGRLASLVRSSLSAFWRVINNDVSTMRRIGTSMDSTDGTLASRLAAGG